MIDIEYWGNHQIDLDSKTLYFNRNSGLCSCISVLTHMIGFLKWGKSFIPENITTKCTLYKDLNLYDYIFKIDKNNLSLWNNFDNERVKLFNSKAPPSWWGLGNNHNDIILDTLNLITNTFFNFHDCVIEESEKIKSNYGITGDYNFLIWRQTDKTQDIVNYPSVEEALLYADDNIKTFCHTDDQLIADKLSFKNIYVLNELPRTPPEIRGIGGHHYINDFTKEKYFNLYNHTFEDHIVKLFAILHIASTSKNFVGYPGNMSFFVFMLRNGINNSFIFNEKNKLY